MQATKQKGRAPARNATQTTEANDTARVAFSHMSASFRTVFGEGPTPHEIGEPVVHPGHVYLVDLGEGRVKVGRSINPAQRIRAVETQAGKNAVNKWVSPMVPDHYAVESAILRSLADHRGMGEWVTCGFDEALAHAKDALDRFGTTLLGGGHA